MSGPLFLGVLRCGSGWRTCRGHLLFHLNSCFHVHQSVGLPFHLICKFLNLCLGLMRIWGILIFHSHFRNDPAGIIMPGETGKESHLP
jgi:hypothetical protein